MLNHGQQGKSLPRISSRTGLINDETFMGTLNVFFNFLLLYFGTNTGVSGRVTQDGLWFFGMRQTLMSAQGMNTSWI